MICGSWQVDVLHSMLVLAMDGWWEVHRYRWLHLLVLFWKRGLLVGCMHALQGYYKLCPIGHWWWFWLCGHGWTGGSWLYLWNCMSFCYVLVCMRVHIKCWICRWEPGQLPLYRCKATNQGQIRCLVSNHFSLLEFIPNAPLYLLPEPPTPQMVSPVYHTKVYPGHSAHGFESQTNLWEYCPCAE